jgi:hypothetical protein
LQDGLRTRLLAQFPNYFKQRSRRGVVRPKKEEIKTILQEINEMQAFWTKAKISIVNRQPGTTIRELERTDIFSFFHILSISEKNQNARINKNKP